MMHKLSQSYQDIGTIMPDPERLNPLQEFLPPKNLPSHRRVLGMFVYYAKWMLDF